MYLAILYEPVKFYDSRIIAVFLCTEQKLYKRTTVHDFYTLRTTVHNSSDRQRTSEFYAAYTVQLYTFLVAVLQFTSVHNSCDRQWSVVSVQANVMQRTLYSSVHSFLVAVLHRTTVHNSSGRQSKSQCYAACTLQLYTFLVAVLHCTTVHNSSDRQRTSQCYAAYTIQLYTFLVAVLHKGPSACNCTQFQRTSAYKLVLCRVHCTDVHISSGRPSQGSFSIQFQRATVACTQFQ